MIYSSLYIHSKSKEDLIQDQVAQEEMIKIQKTQEMQKQAAKNKESGNQDNKDQYQLDPNKIEYYHRKPQSEVNFTHMQAIILIAAYYAS